MVCYLRSYLPWQLFVSLPKLRSTLCDRLRCSLICWLSMLHQLMSAILSLISVLLPVLVALVAFFVAWWESIHRCSSVAKRLVLRIFTYQTQTTAQYSILDFATSWTLKDHSDYLMSFYVVVRSLGQIMKVLQAASLTLLSSSQFGFSFCGTYRWIRSEPPSQDKYT